MKLAILGCGIGYTLSPTIHKTIFDYVGEPLAFDVFDVKESELDGAMETLKSYDGFYVTKPYKNVVEKYLTEVHSSVGVNVVSRGKGYSTDGKGFVAALRGEKYSSCLIMGAGGAARSIAHSLKDVVSKAYIINRDRAKAEAIAKAEGISVYDGSEVELIVNAVTPPSDEFNPLDVFEPNTEKVKCAFDIVYSNRVTQFMKSFGGKVKVIGGLDMLFYQAIFGDEIILNKSLDKEKIFKVLKENIR